MTTHHFEVEDAIEHGVEKAVILYNIRFWLEKVRANNKDHGKHDGYYWTYNSAEAFAKIFPYYNKSKIHRMLKQLEDDGAVLSGNFNKMAYDRTKWYSLPEFSILEDCNVQIAEVQNGSDESATPIPDSNPDSNPDVISNTKDTNNINIKDTTASAKKTKVVNICFSDFWNIYDKKKDTAKCEKKWLSLTDNERELIMAHIPAYVKSTPDKKYRKNPMTYLNGKCWLDEIDQPTATKIDRTTDKLAVNQKWAGANTSNIVAANTSIEDMLGDNA